jgi:hypothetical protein
MWKAENGLRAVPNFRPGSIPSNRDLSAFERRGSKMIVAIGTPIPNTFDRLALLVDWVENGKAPGGCESCRGATSSDSLVYTYH